MTNDERPNIPPPHNGLPPEPTFGEKIKRFFAPVVAVLVMGFKFIAPALKFFPVILKTGGSMVLMIAVYGMAYGWWFAVGFVLLIFVHECGHLLAAKRLGLKTGAPIFIPFMGAIIALKDAPPNAWVEAQVGIGGPLLGALGAAVCEGIYLLTGNLIFRALAYSGFFLNLFNLAPISPLDGGRIVTALSPWFWVAGLVILILLPVLQIIHLNLLVALIVIFSLPRLFMLFRKKTDAELRYFEVTPAQRWTMAAMYFGLIGLLMAGMELTFIPRGALE